METLNTLGKLEAEMRPSFQLPRYGYQPSPSPTPSLSSGSVSTEKNPEFVPPSAQCSYSQLVHCFLNSLSQILVMLSQIIHLIIILAMSTLHYHDIIIYVGIDGF